MDLSRVFLKRQLATADQILAAKAAFPGLRIDRALIAQGVFREEQSLQALGDELGMRFIPLKEFQPDLTLLARFPTTAIFKHEVLPIEGHNGRMTVAISDPFNLESLDELSSLGGCRIEPVLACRDEIVELIKKTLGVGGDTINLLVAQRQEEGVELLDAIPDEFSELAQSAQAPSVIKLVNELLIEALEQRASDIHVEPQERGLAVRFRIDGMLRIQPLPPEINQFANAIVTRLKIMARLNIAEKRLPQDGRINIRVQGREVDVRMSIIPMLHGEGIVLRLLDKQRMVFNLKGIGMPDDVYDKFHELIQLPHGIVLVTGPTGSGKTTTLYSGLAEIATPEVKIITVEDPVEYNIAGISQIQVHAKIGLTFAAGLRSILRHDPDVVLIGEIRDGETATSAIQASLTGHLVFSTLHTNDAPSSFTRLVDMGVEPYLVASTVEGILAQRLIRRLCKACKQPYIPEPRDLPEDFPEAIGKTIYKAVGCRQCREAGYSGRAGVYELLVTDKEIRRLCTAGASSGSIREHALQAGMQTLRQSGYGRVLRGETTLEEVQRITRGDVA